MLLALVLALGVLGIGAGLVVGLVRTLERGRQQELDRRLDA